MLCFSKLIDKAINETRAQRQVRTRDEHGFVEVDYFPDLDRLGAKVMRLELGSVILQYCVS